jgi:OOP family OmpA-OmpF porin
MRLSLGFACSLAVLLAVPALAEDAKPPQAARPTFKLENGQLELPSPIRFQQGTDKLAEESTPALEHLRAYLEDKSYVAVRIEGHGAEASSQALSEKRALAVARWLVEKGVDCKRLIPVGFGNTKPVADPGTPEGKEKNQRITVANAMLRGRPIGGMPVDGGGKLAGDACAKP